jgi:hypothetical protein
MNRRAKRCCGNETARLALAECALVMDAGRSKGRLQREAAGAGSRPHSAVPTPPAARDKKEPVVGTGGLVEFRDGRGTDAGRLHQPTPADQSTRLLGVAGA